ncbi:DGQHR domain-containing protein [Bacillus sp. ISL-7]|uniref:DGQHR domain-containing protein n=1 Tax=Bacillus sp. ISL-7 TaxID=2819136 RepID=UPI001BE9D1C9|nr:DGQHR domain-containing protein [Bacillus sp. ISL-7]MBT2734117.1 DGQHR domain-containing protein [Bacillus sp. ISL-7]
MSETILFGFLGDQRGRKVITGVIDTEDLIDIYEIDVWKPGKPIDEQGCQRHPVQSHFRKIGRKMKEQNSWLPTSITLSANLNKGEKESINSIKIERTDTPNLVKIVIPEGHKLRVVDGQHRILGLEYAITDLKQFELKKFQIPFVMMIVNDRIDEITSFYEINSTPKRVSTDLALQLLNEMKQNTSMKLTKAEKWKLVALNVSMALSEKTDSVWYNNISVGQIKDGEIASSTSFVTSLKPILEISFIKKIWENNLDEQDAGERIADLVNAYWNGLKRLMPDAFPETKEDKDKWVIQKTPGFFSWHMVAPFVIDEYMVKREKIKEFTPETIAEFMQKYADRSVKDYDEFWKASNREAGIQGGDASRANSQKAFKELADQIKDEIESNYAEYEEADIIF